jgi:two-component system, cell cycle sensor histidine kinase and response regulator CckA
MTLDILSRSGESTSKLVAAKARLRAVIDIGLELASDRDPDRLLHTVCSAARDLFGATYVTLGIVNLHDRTVRRFVTCGGVRDPSIRPGTPAPTMLQAVVAERRVMRGENPDGHPDIQAFLAVPIASPSQVYGWFCLVSNGGKIFSKEDEDLVTALSGQIGRVYENGHFHAMAQKRQAQLEREILERRMVEATLRHERDRAQQYLDTAQVILLVLDTEGRVTTVNRYACTILGWKADELIGRDWISTCVPKRLQKGVRDSFREIVRMNDRMTTLENPIVTRTGEERLIEWRNTIVHDDDGHAIATISSGTDITARVQAVTALHETEERMRFALENAGVGIWDVDYATGVVQWSEILEAQYGLQPGTFGGTFEAFLELCHPEDRETLRDAIEKGKTSGTDFSFQTRAIWPDGTVHWLSSAGRVHLGDRGAPVRGVGISLDITDRHSLEEQYQQAQKMEAVGRLAGGVAHDFNNLLTVILGNCELSLMDLDPAQPSYVDVIEIQRAGMRAVELTRQLLAFSRKQLIESTFLDLNLVVTDMRSMLKRLIREDVEVLLRHPLELMLVRANRGQVEQIIMNLAVNARDAMPKGGTLTIATGNIDLDEAYVERHPDSKPGRYVAITVSDTGTGVTPEVGARLFEPFYTTKDAGKGTGLGLATVHGIVKQMGGSIDFTSVVGRGTTFNVYFPV